MMSNKRTSDDESKLYIWTDTSWERFVSYKGRTLDSVILPHGDVEEIVHDIEWFLRAEDWYRNLGIPYHRGYLLYGIPGTGKSSLISGLANKFGMPIYLMSLNEMCDRTLLHAMATVTAGSIVVLEDVDCMGRTRKQLQPPQNPQNGNKTPDTPESIKDPLGVTLSGLLNVLDGFKSPNGVMFVMTTNHMERLDPALLRAGRVDYRLRFELAKLEQKQELYKRFYPDKSEQDGFEFIMENRSTNGQTMADFQEKLMASYQTQNKTNGGIQIQEVPFKAYMAPNDMRPVN